MSRIPRGFPRWGGADHIILDPPEAPPSHPPAPEEFIHHQPDDPPLPRHTTNQSGQRQTSSDFQPFKEFYKVPALEAQKKANPALIFPQDGPQLAFLSTPADIAIYGGAAGGGKTWSLLLEALRHINNPHYGAVIFRRTSVQVRNEGGLWDESLKMYPAAQGTPRAHDLYWKFPSGASISFAHLEHEKTVHDWQGSQIPLICFDELTHFTESQFYYLLSRNRSTSGVRPYIRATCNPDVDSWVSDFIQWFINPDTGYPIPERAGKLRWFLRIGDKLIWADKPSELSNYKNPLTGEPIAPKSMTFIPSKLTDNKVLLNSDPGYSANLMALPLVERERLLEGNWLIRNTGRAFFNPASFLVNGFPVLPPMTTDSIFAVIDTALKSGAEHDGTAVVWATKNKFTGHPLVFLDYDYVQIDGDMLESWLPYVHARGEQLAAQHRAREGYLGAWVEDKGSGIIINQAAARRGLKVFPIESKLTAMGKDERALSVSGYVQRGMVKLSEDAYRKVVTFKNTTRNHLTQQLDSFSIGDTENKKRADDLFDAAIYAIAIALGDHGGF